MNYAEFVRRLPKAELHIHYEGSMRQKTFFELARKNGIPLPTENAEELYNYDTLVDFLKIYDLCAKAIRDQGDFARVAYESLEDGVKRGNLRYREMFFNPTTHTSEGVRYETVMDGMLEGIRAAEKDFGVRCRLIPSIYRAHSPRTAQEMMETLVQRYRDDIIGMGSDALPDDGTEGLQHFVKTYRYAKQQGLRVSAHAAESKNTSHNFTYALDTLGCDRIDHGYDVLASDDLVKRAVDEGIFFTCCLTAVAVTQVWPDLTRQPIREMAERGINITLNSDDPAMFNTDIGKEFVLGCESMEFSVDRAVQLALAGIDGSWLDETEKKSMRSDFEKEIAALRSELSLAA
ncbi:adenosine deaminase [Mesorhizobium sp. NPDC059025]|uniref:adenosine deaminase n=1 Tax=unclassified Mesorhizobium TaxID=325217 RepID=UPI0036CF98B1